MSAWFDHPMTSKISGGVGGQPVTGLLVYREEARTLYAKYFPGTPSSSTSSSTPIAAANDSDEFAKTLDHVLQGGGGGGDGHNVIGGGGGGGKMRIEWTRKVLSSAGTQSDRMEMFVKLIRQNPMATLALLDRLLIQAANPAKKRDCILALQTAGQLFNEALLPNSRPLYFFKQRPFSTLQNDATSTPKQQQQGETETNDSKKSKKKKKSANQHSGVEFGEGVRQRALCLWWFEEQLKSRLHAFIKAAECVLLAADQLEHGKRAAASLLLRIAAKKPEGRDRILQILLNKIGDNNRSLVSHVLYGLEKLVRSKQTLIPFVLMETCQFVFRANLSAQCRVQLVRFMAQIQISPQIARLPIDQSAAATFLSSFPAVSSAQNGGDQSAATNRNTATSPSVIGMLVQSLTRLFREEISANQSSTSSTTTTTTSPLLSCIINAMSRVLDQAGSDRANLLSQSQLMQTELDFLFRLSHTARTAQLRLETLSLLQRLCRHSPAQFSRFLNALYARLSDPELVQQRVFSASNTSNSSNTSNASNSSNTNKSTSSLSSSSAGERLLQLCVSSMEMDGGEAGRVRAFAKRLLQLCVAHPDAGFVCRALLCLSRLCARVHPRMLQPCPAELAHTQAHTYTQQQTNQGGDAAAIIQLEDENEDEEELENDDDDDGDDDDGSGDEEEKKRRKEELEQAQEWGKRLEWKAKSNQTARKDKEEKEERTTKNSVSKENDKKQKERREGEYDSRTRNALAAHAEEEPIFELHLLCTHSHPSVAAFALQLMQQTQQQRCRHTHSQQQAGRRRRGGKSGGAIDYASNPIEDMSLMRFLERFCFKNPKKSATTREDGGGENSSAAAAAAALANQSGMGRPDSKFIETYLSQLREHGDQTERGRVRKTNEEREHGGEKNGEADLEGEDVDDEEFDAFMDDYEKQHGNEEDEDDEQFDIEDADDDDDESDVEDDEEMEFDGEDEEMDVEEADEEDEENAVERLGYAAGARKGRTTIKMNNILAGAEEISNMFDTQSASEKIQKQRNWEKTRNRGGKQRGAGLPAKNARKFKHKARK